MTAHDPLAEARRLSKTGDINAALRILSGHLQQYPDDTNALILRISIILPYDASQAINLANGYLQSSPSDPDGHDLLGQARSALGLQGAAVAAFQQAVECDPERPNLHCNYSVALTRANRFVEAENAAQKALNLSQNYLPALNALGLALTGQGKESEAIAIYQKALKLSPNHPDALTGVGQAHKNLGQLTAAILALRRAHRVAPSRIEPLMDLGPLYREAGAGQLAAETYRQLKSQSNGVAATASNGLLDMLYDPDVTAEELYRAAADFGSDALQRYKGPLVPTTPNLKKSSFLRIGYVSADIRQHAAGWLGAAALVEHDPERIEAYYYDNGGKADRLTQRVKSAPATKGWVDIRDMDDISAAQRIANDGIDILVDLSGHTRGNRLGIFALRAAPIQIGWLGYPGSTGLPTIDYAVFDEWHTPAGAEAQFTESLVRLHRTRFAFMPPDYAPDVSPGPRDTSGHITFGSFNNSSKLHPSLIKTWASILHAVPNSRLLLKWRSFADPVLRSRISQWFASFDIEVGRISFEGQSLHSDMLAGYEAIDIALDTFPFSGGVTTAEALYMGVPVVSRYTERPASRQGLSMLNAIGKADWAQPTEAGYIAKAIEIAGDEAVLAQQRHALRSKLMASPLGDGKSLSRALERAYFSC